MSTDFSLKSFSDDRKLAIFQGEERDGDLRSLQRHMISEALAAATVEEPVPFVQFRRQVHDTEVPRMQFDSASFELSFDLRGLYSAFFAAEMRYERMMQGWVGGRSRDIMLDHEANAGAVHRLNRRGHDPRPQRGARRGRDG